MKDAGKADTTHKSAISDEDLASIFKLGAQLHEIIKGKNVNIPGIQSEKIPSVVQKFVILMVGIHQARRGREGFDSLKKTDFKVFEHPKIGKYVKQVVTRSSKNHKDDSQDSRLGGILVCSENCFGLNCGELFLNYIAKLDPEYEYLFAKPRRATKDGALKRVFELKTWYEKAKAGKNTVSQALPTLSEILGLERITNDKMRPTAIQLLKRAGFSDREIMNTSGKF